MELKIRHSGYDSQVLVIAPFILLLLFHLPINAQSDFQKSTGIYPNSSVDSIASFAEELSSSQFHVSKKAASKVKQQLADLALKWAKIARVISQQKANEVVHITRKAQDAQIFSLKTSSVSTQLQSSVFAAQTAFASAFARYKTLSSLAKAAETHSLAAAVTLDHFLEILAIRERWAMEEQKRAWRLSQHLQSVLRDLKVASEFAQEAQEYARKAETPPQGVLHNNLQFQF